MQGDNNDCSKRTSKALSMNHPQSLQLGALGLIAAGTACCLASPDARAVSTCENPSRLDPQERTLCTLEGWWCPR